MQNEILVLAWLSLRFTWLASDLAVLIVLFIQGLPLSTAVVPLPAFSEPYGSPGDYSVARRHIPTPAESVPLQRNAHGRRPGVILIYGKERMHAAGPVIRHKAAAESACAKTAAGKAHAFGGAFFGG